METNKALQNAYKVMMDNCDIKVGDKVRVLRRANDYELGWPRKWDDCADYMIGRFTTISERCEDGFKIIGEHNNFVLPFFILQRLGPHIMKMDIDGNIVEFHPNRDIVFENQLPKTIKGYFFDFLVKARAEYLEG